MGDEPQYNEGGYIGGTATYTWLDPDECLFSFEDIHARRWHCSRAGHPTSTSDCHRG